jgi:hypothetical protein
VGVDLRAALFVLLEPEKNFQAWDELAGIVQLVMRPLRAATPIYSCGRFSDEIRPVNWFGSMHSHRSELTFHWHA